MKATASAKPVYFSSKTVEWATPPALFAKLDAEFGFTLDVCATPENAKCARHFTRADDGLKQDWGGAVAWCNPPYGRDIGKWMHKARVSAATRGATVVCLVPAKTDTTWWHDSVLFASEIRFIRGRLCFGGCGVAAPFPAAIVVFRPHCRKQVVRWYTPTSAERGRIVEVTR